MGARTMKKRRAMLKKCLSLFVIILTLSLLRPPSVEAAYPDGFSINYTGAIRPLYKWDRWTEPWRNCPAGEYDYRVSTVWTGRYWEPPEDPNTACEGTGTHGGVDIPAPYGTAVRSFGAGRVDWIWEVGQTDWGNAVTIRHVDMPDASHGSGVTVGGYAHFSEFVPGTDGLVRGRVVLRGTTIGKVGSTGWSTGNHLHFQVDKDLSDPEEPWHHPYGNFGSVAEVQAYTWEPTMFVDSHYVMLGLSQSLGVYYNGMSLDWDGDGAQPEGSCVGCYCDNERKEVDCEWGYGPAPFNLYDQYSVRWRREETKFCIQNTGWTLFILTTDDGARVWVDGGLIFDAWYDQAPTTYGTGVWLNAWEQHNLQVEYYENGWHSVIQVAWGNDPRTPCP
jgi:hypothetical protein